MKLFVRTTKLTQKTKNKESKSSLEVAEVVLVQCSLVDNQYKKNLKLWYMDDYVFDKCIFYYFRPFEVLYYTHCQGTALQ